MRAELVFDMKKSEISLDYRRIVLSWLKACLSECNQGKYYDKYFGNISPKDYAFSVIFTGAKFTKERIYLDDPKLKILFSTDDRNKTGLIFFSAFLGMKNKKFLLPEGNYMVLRSVQRKNEVLITEPTVYFQTCLGSGLCIREHDRETNRDRFVSCEDDDFREKAREVLKIQAELAGFPKRMLENLDIEAVRCRKVVVFFYNRYVDTTAGVFCMRGEPDVLQYFYSAGVGSKHSAGYGMFNVLRQGKGEEA